MRIAVFYFTDNGEVIADRICDSFEKNGCDFEKHKKLSFVSGCFSSCDLIVFVSAVGIAVRGIAPFVKDKKTDPAVVCLDDCGRFAISLLSGHIGGGNDFTRQIAEIIGAVPVITTATDNAGKFACDSWAVKNACKISSMAVAKEVSAEILKRDVAFASDFAVLGSAGGIKLLGKLCEDVKTDGVGIYLTYKTSEPFERTLSLVPSCLAVGIGCKRGVSFERIRDAVFGVFAENGLNISAVSGVYSIDLKCDEVGILDFAKSLDVPAEFYSKEELLKVQGEFESSEFVKSITGVDCVCERACLADKKGKLIVKKTPCGGVTVAVAVLDKEYRL